VPSGSPDNVVAAGQSVSLAGSGTTLGFLGVASFGATTPASGTGTIMYTDGTTQQFTLTYPDWWANTNPPSGDILATVPYINEPSGQVTQKNSVYYVGVALQPGKTVATVTLPDVSGGQVGQNITAMHIFAISIG
jgi:hypothetical protein